MKVTFTCEQCDSVAYVGRHFETGSELDQSLDCMEKDRFGLPPCPNCAKLTYGPFTEEMMAEALWESQLYESEGFPWAEVTGCRSGVWDGTISDIESQARFVLRLLKDEQLSVYPPTLKGGVTAEDWREVLLRIAREK